MESAGQSQFFLATQPAGPPERKAAFILLGLSFLLFLGLAPFAKIQLPPVFAFIPIYEAALIVTDLITAVLLFGQYNVLRKRWLLVLAAGYVYSALLTVSHALTFPGLFAPTGLLGAGPQSTAWLYMFWHGGFPFFVIAYAWLKRRPQGDSPPARTGFPREGALCFLAVLAGVVGITAVATAGHDALPVIMVGNRYSPILIVVVSATWGCSLLALVVLWLRRPHTLLDLSLMVVMTAWLFDIALAAILNGGRFDLGFYSGRLYGLLATSLVLVTQLIENGMLYSRLARAHESEQQERRRAEEATLAADEANKAKSVFLANMSHELRTPLSAILGYSDLILDDLRGGGTPEGLAADVMKIHSAGSHLLGLINDILDIAKIEAGRMELYIERFDLRNMLEDVVTTATPLVEKNGNILEVSLTVELDGFRSDLTKVKQILLNLLSNAAKFTKQGTIRLSANVEESGAVGRAVVLAVSDTGMGMTPQQIGKLFQPFTQADASITRHHGGTGLGLAITKVYCEMLGGSISASSEAGKGTTFQVRLPVDRFPVEEATSESEAAVESMQEAPVVPGAAAPLALIIDDDPHAQLLLRRQLEKAGFTVHVAGNGEDGVRLARSLVPQLITLDIMMPGMDGWQVMAALRSNPALADIPVIVISIVNDKNRGYRLGASDYLVKPIDRHRFASMLRRYHTVTRGRRALVIEPDDTARTLLKHVLTQDGWAVVEMQDHAAALNALRSGGADIVVTSLVARNNDTLEFIDTMKRDAVLAPIPIVVVAASDLSAMDREALNARVADGLAQGGWSVEELLGQVRDLARGATR